MDEDRIVSVVTRRLAFKCGSIGALGSILDRKVCGRCGADLLSSDGATPSDMMVPTR